MKSELKKSGFSLTEVLIAVNILAVGMIFIAGVFPVGIRLTTTSIEQTTAAVVADEAFAKIRLFTDPNNLGSVDLSGLAVDTLTDFAYAFPAPPAPYDPCEFAYPSTDTDIMQKRYYWSALCRLTEGPYDPSYPAMNRLVQVTVFVSRKTGAGTRYWFRNPNGSLNQFVNLYPKPIPINVTQPLGSNPDELWINDILPNDNVDESTFINDGYTIVDDRTGQIYRVLERYAGAPQVIKLDRPWQGVALPGETEKVWVVPPPVGGGKYPCIAVYQKVIRF